ncbi:hypothetical protein ID866_7730 [Astraeus odoratus]|nr:hypothetical protein ID866_7730 [Astraeus odoratus]
MLQRSGWNEGEGLGAHVARTYDRPTNAAEAAKRGGGRPSSTSTIPDGLLTTEDNGPGAVAQRHGVEIIDLTLSDAESEQDFETLQASQSHVKVSARPPGETSASQQKSLLTPIPTVLKADRLGIGLKAKTEGPYKQSKKRVTHNAAALSAHIKASEETRRKKAEVGRGRRGFAKLHKREEERRKSMLAYFNE